MHYARHYSWLIVALFLFAIIFLLADTPEYIEGDDAVSISYHLFGHDADFQPPYTPRQGMMDVVFGFLPAEEALLRSMAVFVSNIAAVTLFILILALVFEWLPDITSQQKLIATVIVLFASPEFFYLGLLYNPTLIAMSLILAAHLLIRHTVSRYARAAFPTTGMLAGLAVSLILFGLGVSFRWNVIVYGVVIVADVFSGNPFRGRGILFTLRQRIVFVTVWGGLALAASLAMIYASGYTLHTIIDELKLIGVVARQTGSAQQTIPTINIRTGLTLMSLITPAAFVLSVVGFVRLVRQRDAALLLVVLVSGLGVLPIVPSGVPKFLITSIPALILLVVEGWVAIWNLSSRQQLQSFVKATLVATLIVPWFVGIHILRPGTAWGPGFELRSYDRPEDSASTQIALAFDSGAAYPTPEGLRPIFGHAYTLLAGDWRAMYHQLAAENRQLVDVALEQNIPILVTQFPPSYVVNELVARGFSTQAKSKQTSRATPFIRERLFSNAAGQTVTVLYIEIQDSEVMIDFTEVTALSAMWDTVLINGYPRTIRHLAQIAPTAHEKVGPLSAILDLQQFTADFVVMLETSERASSN